MLLAVHIGKSVPVMEAMDEVYGKKKGSTTAFARVVAGVRKIIESRSLPYELVEAKTRRGKTIALYPIEQDACKVFAAGATLAAVNPKNGFFGDD